MAEDLGRVLLGRYRLIEPLGRGGMGTVWRAHDERLGRQVAIKELRLPDDLDSEQRATWTARLDREARAAARLRHPGIVGVHDLVIGDDGQPWIVMELVQGPSLATLLAEQGPISPARAAALGLQILEALAAAHQAGIIHRDLKPANVLLEGDRVLLTDFGIAVVDGDATLTRSGALLGTPAFMAPEQIRGQAVTAACDLWALGATLYTVVEGHPPFEGATTGAVLVAVATDDPAPMTAAGPLAPVIGALLHKDPAQRPTSDDLRAMLTHVTSAPSNPAPSTPAAVTASEPPPPRAYAPPVPGPTPRYPHPAPLPPKRRPAVLIGAAAAAILILIGAGAALVYALKNPAYDANKRAAAALGAPSGFTLKSEHKIEGDRVRRTFSGCRMFCGQGARLQATQINYVRNWLRTLHSVAAVSPPQIMPDGTSCVVPVRTATGPEISNVRITISQKPKEDFLLQLDVG
ncbi:serine/threonine-protein kinase [Actinoallomurus vinaceus]|uniref:serine/threonine-protein kinase n=1 Tax=Actinoallomurus vinaceus TaxID=1080074 RepID=UPI0031E66F46